MAGFTRAVAVLVWLSLILIPQGALAHPLGNFTTNQFLAVHATTTTLTVDYVLDLAEIPASQTRRQIDADGDEVVTDVESTTFAGEECESIPGSLAITLQGVRQDLGAAQFHLSFPDGEAGLTTMRLECSYETAIDLDSPMTLELTNGNFTDRIGWHELIVTSEDVSLDTELPSESVTGRLTSYPEELLTSPVDVRYGAALLAPQPGITVGAAPPGVGQSQVDARTPVDALASLIDPGAGSPALPIAMAVAVGLGVVHALAPGHGKTVMAAYLVGSRGNLAQALGLGVAVAVSHTVGVLALGLVTLAGTSAFAPEKVFPVLSLISGLIVTAIGLWMLIRWFRRDRGHPDDHTHDSSDATGDDEPHLHEHSHGGIRHSHQAPTALGDVSGWKVLASMGLAGGLVPSTSAVVLLLAAVNLGRVPLGILLIVLFGVGMAATLVTVGFALVTARRFGLERLGGGGWLDRLRGVLTPFAALVVVVVGAFLSIGAV